MPQPIKPGDMVIFRENGDAQYHGYLTNVIYKTIDHGGSREIFRLMDLKTGCAGNRVDIRHLRKINADDVVHALTRKKSRLQEDVEEIGKMMEDLKTAPAEEGNIKSIWQMINADETVTEEDIKQAMISPNTMNKIVERVEKLNFPGIGE